MAPKARKEVVTREYTVNLGKQLKSVCVHAEPP